MLESENLEGYGLNHVYFLSETSSNPFCLSFPYINYEWYESTFDGTRGPGWGVTNSISLLIFWKVKGYFNYFIDKDFFSHCYKKCKVYF